MSNSRRNSRGVPDETLERLKKLENDLINKTTRDDFEPPQFVPPTPNQPSGLVPPSPSTPAPLPVLKPRFQIDPAKMNNFRNSPRVSGLLNQRRVVTPGQITGRTPPSARPSGGGGVDSPAMREFSDASVHGGAAGGGGGVSGTSQGRRSSGALGGRSSSYRPGSFASRLLSGIVSKGRRLLSFRMGNSHKSQTDQDGPGPRRYSTGGADVSTSARTRGRYAYGRTFSGVGGMGGGGTAMASGAFSRSDRRSKGATGGDGLGLGMAAATTPPSSAGGVPLGVRSPNASVHGVAGASFGLSPPTGTVGSVNSRKSLFLSPNGTVMSSSSSMMGAGGSSSSFVPNTAPPASMGRPGGSSLFLGGGGAGAAGGAAPASLPTSQQDIQKALTMGKQLTGRSFKMSPAAPVIDTTSASGRRSSAGLGGSGSTFLPPPPPPIFGGSARDMRGRVELSLVMDAVSTPSPGASTSSNRMGTPGGGVSASPPPGLPRPPPSRLSTSRPPHHPPPAASMQSSAGPPFLPPDRAVLVPGPAASTERRRRSLSPTPPLPPGYPAPHGTGKIDAEVELHTQASVPKVLPRMPLLASTSDAAGSGPGGGSGPGSFSAGAPQLTGLAGLRPASPGGGKGGWGSRLKQALFKKKDGRSSVSHSKSPSPSPTPRGPAATGHGSHGSTGTAVLPLK